MSFAEYATHDDRAESSERMDDAAIIQVVVSECETVAVGDSEDPDDSLTVRKVLLNVMTQEKLRKKKLSSIYCISVHYFSAEGLHSP